MPPIELTLPTTRKGVDLVLRPIDAGRQIAASLYLSRKPLDSLVFAIANKEDAYVDADDHTLWIGRAAFKLQKKEADRVVAEFGIETQTWTMPA